MRSNIPDLTLVQSGGISTKEWRRRGRWTCCETSLIGYAFSCMRRVSVRKKMCSLWMLTWYMRSVLLMPHRRQVSQETRRKIKFEDTMMWRAFFSHSTSRNCQIP
ncbi:hypothetical protein HZU73_08644 [Apis mellifera caucasica]|uniref:Uncharacterized protein LOC113219029 n=1 Tax=Apis mellifera TaxID=7460 RepID=A0A7M7MP85_APIME|nr:uncharacterized protein LOC113219029 [Apis mellifera]KAG6796005.1 hypothetical protein HZU73_08644 [Apis mellifera caucasica]KAG9430412.1 hypothetical protein HZU67_07615 [Apis mellifera carnica]|eukprot:XP_026298927.1 uncharacterized protein LOC113219029 [Apis mellifera]